MDALERIIDTLPAWTTDELGCNVRRESIGEDVENAVLDEARPFADLLAAVDGSTRKTWSRKAIIELIEEYTP